MLKSKVIITVFVSILFYQSIVQGQWMQSSVINQGSVSAITVKDSIIILGGMYLSDSTFSYFYSKDYGDSWTECFNVNTLAGGLSRSIVITDDYIFTAQGGGESGCIFRTSDWGLNWEECFGYEFGYRDPRCLIYYAGTLYAGTFSDCGGKYVVKSSDNGDTWTVIWNDGTVDSQGILSIVAVDSFIFAGTGNAGVYGSSDYGNTWTELNNGLPPNSTVNSMILFDNRIFITAGGIYGGVYYSIDYGLNWQTLNEGINSCGIFAASNDILFTASLSEVYVLLEQEMRWLDITGDLPDSLYNYALAVCDDKLFLGTGLNGLWYRSIAGITDVKKESGIPSTFALSQNYPNPFNPTTTISFDLPEETTLEIVIYNLMGCEIWKSSKSSYTSGTHAITWNGTNNLGQPVGAGMYLLRLNSRKYSATQKVLLMK